MKLYLSGPMTGLPHLNFPAFFAEARRLRDLGYDVVNPAEINPDPDAEWVDCLKMDIKALLDCDGIAMLPGWQTSRGARLEHHIASTLSFRVFDSYKLVSVIKEPQ